MLYPDRPVVEIDLIKNLLTVLPGLQFSVSYTTRPVRQDEVEGTRLLFCHPGKV